MQKPIYFFLNELFPSCIHSLLNKKHYFDQDILDAIGTTLI
jgi:hypothetical protein